MPRTLPSPRKPAAAKPLLSQAGNPYPPGLEPVVIDFTPLPGVPLERMWPRPLDPDPPPPDRAGMVAFDTYLYEVPGPNLPHLTLWLERQRPEESDERYAHYRADLEHHHLVHAVMLKIVQRFATVCGLAATCREHACRRQGACVGVRDAGRFDLPFAMYPPCVPLDLEIMETFRQAVRRLLDEWEEAERDGRQPPAGVKEATSEWRSPG
ncbi:MAG: hypothetical protein ACTHNH_19975 [Mesorhizobium sp.]